MVFAEVSLKRFKFHLQNHQNILSILTIKFQSQKVWSLKNQISVGNRLKNGTSENDLKTGLGTLNQKI